MREECPMRHAAKAVRFVAAFSIVAALGASQSIRVVASPTRQHVKLDPVLRQRVSSQTGRSRVIVRASHGVPRDVVSNIVRQLGGTPFRALPIINGYSATVPNAALAALAALPSVAHVSLDRPVVGTVGRTGAAVGATAVRQELGYDGSTVGVAILDSGITAWHDDLSGAPGSAQRVDRFVDFVNGRETPYDDFGHGTHVAGIVAGNGFDSGGARSGIAPAARLTVLKVLDSSGRGYISHVIAALDYIVAHKRELNIRIANLSIAAVAIEDYDVDPLTLAAHRAVTEGIVVIAAAGNAGRSADGRAQYEAVMAPGNAPWVLTVGASTHMGTVDGTDDAVAAFSSRGPGAGGASAKPDLVAPGVGIESLSDPDSAFYTSRSDYLLSGTVLTAYMPYLSLSGTSMSAPVVSGTVALMVQANPSLTPNQVKAMLQYTAAVRDSHNPLEQGAGFLNARGAVELARYFADSSPGPFPAPPKWSRRIIWGNRLFDKGRPTADANAWPTSTTWGDTATVSGEAINFGVTCSAADCDADAASWTGWGVSSPSRNVVWGTRCGGDDCDGSWSIDAISALDGNDAVVWGMNDDDAVVWGMNDDAVVWGLTCTDPSCQPVIWSGR
jgi:serine protease AprX